MKNTSLLSGTALSLIMTSFCIITSCEKSNVSPAVIVKFSTTTSNYNESQGIVNGVVNVDLTLSNKASQDITLTYTWSSADTATFLGGDFSFVSPSPLIIKAGQTTATISVKIIDDTQVDNDDILSLTLLSATNATVSATPGDLVHKMTITNNDVVAANQLQMDLTWKVITTSKPPLEVNGINLDLYAQYDVVITNNQITSIGKTNSKSINTNGFESLFINSTDPDKVYYIAIDFVSGTSKVAFGVALNGWGYANNQSAPNVAPGDFVPSEVGSAVFFGPFTKTNNTFVFTGRSAQTPIQKYTVRNFVPN